METLEQIKQEVRKVIVGQEEMVELAMVGLMAGGHVLLEGVPGVAKTLLVKTLAKIISLDFKRIQFTPDLMPSDITGTKIFNMQTREFELKKGPIFTNLLLADEINRTPPKTQAGLLEAMAESSVTIEGEMMGLDAPYMVFATQNPLEYEGTYPLPEALVDRFLMKIIIDYPSVVEETEILKKHHLGFDATTLDRDEIHTVCSKEAIMSLRKQVEEVKVEEALLGYMASLVQETRKNPMLEVGSSPRGGIAILKCSKALALLKGRNYILPEDIKQMFIPTIRHRIILKAELEIEGVKVEQVLKNILDKVVVPR